MTTRSRCAPRRGKNRRAVHASLTRPSLGGSFYANTYRSFPRVNAKGNLFFPLYGFPTPAHVGQPAFEPGIDLVAERDYSTA